MRKLHVVGFTSDLDGLIFSTRKGSASGGFVVPIGDELYEKLAEVERLRNGGASSGGGVPGDARRGAADVESRPARPESLLTPREIQARLRAGRTIEEVAREARVAPDWVERFALPILAEQRQVVETAQDATFSKARLGPSAEPLGRSVARNLVERGVRMLDEEFDAAWSAYQLHDGVWMVRFQYESRGRAHVAEWQLDVAVGQLAARDRHASDLAYVDPGSRARVAPGNGDDDVNGAEAYTPARVPARPPARRPAARPSSSRRATGSPAPAPGPSPRSANGTGRAAEPARGRAAPAKASKVTTKATKAGKPGKVGTTATRAVAGATGKARAAATPAPARTRSRKAPAPSPAGPARAGRGASVARPEATIAGPPARRRPAAATAAPSGGEGAPARGSDRAERPRIGTDGTRLGTGSSRPRSVPPTPPAPPQTPTARPRPAPPVPDQPRRPVGGSAPAAAANGSASPRPGPAARALPPLQVPRPYEPRRVESAARPMPAGAPSSPPRPSSSAPAAARPVSPTTQTPQLSGPAPAASRPPASRRFDPAPEPSAAGPRRSFDDVDFDDDIDYDEVVGRRKPESGGRGGILGRRRPPATPPSKDENGRGKPDEPEAFVIRPRISAKQASEYSFTDDRPH